MRQSPDARLTRSRRTPFGNGFLWGAATSGYQIEGAAVADGKGPSIWDTFTHQPGRILHGDNGDVACDAYRVEQLEGDLDLMARLGLKAYIFSVQWPRVQPDGRGRANVQGLDYYRRLVDGLNRRHITPVLTLYHWELPEALQARGGWLSRDTVDRFVDYAAIVYDALAGSVPLWVTQNEPGTSAWVGHGEGRHAPGVRGDGNALRAAHHLLLSHGRAVQTLRERIAGVTTRFGPVIAVAPMRPRKPADARHRAAATRLDGARNRLFLDPIFRGEYPADVRRRYREATHDFEFIRDGDLAAISVPLDFLGVNYYAPVVVAPGQDGAPHELPAEGPTTAMGWAIDAHGLDETLQRLQRNYTGGPPLVISENGASFRDYVDPDGRCRDSERIEFLRDHVRAAKRAMQAGVPLKGYFVWSLLDNFEWDSGYRERFGLVHVDYATQRRTPKDSFDWYRRVIAGDERL